MSFVASKLLWLVGNPTTLLLLLLCLSLLLAPTPWRRFGRRLGTTVLILLLVVAVLPIGSWLTAPLENRFPQPELPVRVDGIIGLGGSGDLELTEARGQVALNSSAERLTAFVALARRYPDARLVFSGGTGDLKPGRLREADLAGRLFTDLGLDASRVLFDSRARTTFENAKNLQAAAHPKTGETWLLVTSAWHMPRAIGTFRRLGWEVTAYPVDYRTTGSAELALNFDLGYGMTALHLASREWAGLVFYWLSGRSSSLLPASMAATGPSSGVQAGPERRISLSTG